MANVNPYLDFDGNAEEALNFYKSVFGGEFTALVRYKEMSRAECDGIKLPDDELERIMHITLPIGNSSVLMASDVLESTGQTRIVGTNFSVSIGADSKE